MPDHLHVFFGMRPAQSLSDLMQDMKGSSSKWINEKSFIKAKFEWQERYGAFSYSKSQAARIIAYVKIRRSIIVESLFWKSTKSSWKNPGLTMMSDIFLKQ